MNERIKGTHGMKHGIQLFTIAPSHRVVYRYTQQLADINSFTEKWPTASEKWFERGRTSSLDQFQPLQTSTLRDTC